MVTRFTPASCSLPATDEERQPEAQQTKGKAPDCGSPSLSDSELLNRLAQFVRQRTVKQAPV